MGERDRGHGRGAHLPLDALERRTRGASSPDDPASPELDLYERFLIWAEDDRPHAGPADALDVAANSTARPSAGARRWCGVTPALSNVIFRDFEVVAVLDWEMATVCDPLLDLGWWIFADNTLTVGSGYARLPGFESRDETAARWSQLTGRSTDGTRLLPRVRGPAIHGDHAADGQTARGMGFVPDAFPYDNLVSQGLERQLTRVRT